MAYFVPMGKEETGFATFPLPQKIRTSLSGFLTAFPSLEGDYGLAGTLRAAETAAVPAQSATGAIVADKRSLSSC